MAPQLPSYLLTLRKRSGLSQYDLAALLGLTASALSRFENQSRRPTIELAIATEVIFGHSAKEVFPAFYREIEQVIIARAQQCCDRYSKRPDVQSQAKRHVLTEMIQRANQTTLGL
jgi:transcriptional regulator with XRE-family HTH domain